MLTAMIAFDVGAGSRRVGGMGASVQVAIGLVYCSYERESRAALFGIACFGLLS
jgi:hypothetical protein